MPANTGVLLVPRSLWGCSGRGGGVPGVQVPLPPQQLVVLGDPLASAVVLSAAKGQVGKKKNKHKRRTTYQGTHIPDTWMHLFHGVFFNESTSHYLIGTREFLRLFGPEAFSQQLNFEVQETVWGSYMGLKRSN